MRDTSLKRLADAASVAKIELVPSPLLLMPTESGTVALYRGGYVTCGVMVEDGTMLGATVAVNAEDFAALANVFAGSETALSISPQNAVVVTSGRRRSSLRIIGGEDPEAGAHYASLMSLPPFVTVCLDDLKAEVALAASCAARSYGNPILEGIRVTAAGGKVGIQATNGVSVMLEVSIPALAHIPEKHTVIVPATDFVTALRIMRGPNVEFAVLGRTLVLRSPSDQSVVRVPLMSGEWPTMKAIREMKATQDVRLPIALLTTAIAAAKVYDASILRLVGANGDMTISTHEAQQGG